METTAGDPRTRLSEIENSLRPGVVREQAISSLDDIFRSGTIPQPPLEGFYRGRAITSTLTGPLDDIGRRVAEMYMPWLGKRFDPHAGEGINVLRPNARVPMRILWPRYEPESQKAEEMEAFKFKSYVAPGAVDPNLEVLKIDYDTDDNPSLIIRDILDELVQVDDQLYLGKVLYRLRSGFRRIGFFALEGPGSSRSAPPPSD
jgi:hypothetical protein